MKHILNILVLIASCIFSSQQVQSQDQEQPQATVDSLSKKFFELFMSPASLTLSVTDDKSLDEGIKQLKANANALSEIAKTLKTLQVPSAETRQATDERFTREELAMREGIGQKYKEHLGTMPQGLKEKWKLAIQEFHGSLNKDMSTFKAYFSGKANGSEPAGAGQPATKPADKPPVKGKPSPTTSKDSPR